MSESILHQDILQYIKDFPFNSNGETLVVIHQANCFNTLHRARGIAGILGNAYPDIALADDTTIKGDENKLGTFTYAEINPKLFICNAYGQYGYGMQKQIIYTNYDALEHSLRLIKRRFSHPDTDYVFLIPLYIGAGLANGDTDRIQTFVREIFSDAYKLVLIYN